MPKSIALHSFHRGTGKSVLTANLAALLAAGGQRVGVIDTNLAAPSQHLLFGLDEADMRHTLNEFLRGDCAITEAVYDVTPRLGLAAEAGGKVYLAPASAKISEIMHSLQGSYDLQVLHTGLEALGSAFKLETVLIDMPAGLSDEALVLFAVADCLVILLRPDQQDFQGTAVTAEVARRLNVPRVALVVNQMPPVYAAVDVRVRVAQAYPACEVAGVLPISEEMLALGGRELFVRRYPAHPLTLELKQMAGVLLADQAGGGMTGGTFEMLWQAVAKLKPVDGVMPADVLELPDPLAVLLQKILRDGSLSVAEIAAELHIELAEAQKLSELLMQKGILKAEERTTDGGVAYRVYIARMRPRNIPLDLL